ncbi:DUF4174 domain-containing protein [Kordia sp.]|uniref:DUF4174 domain-containing protein n=1 Tax=Kordia sp. TaxID=1965332 RepID=UPI003B5C1C6E
MKIITLLISFLCCIHINAQDLKKHRWEHRIIIIKTSDVNSKKYKAQKEAFQNVAKEFIDRKLILYTIIANTVTITDYANGLLDTAETFSKNLAKKFSKGKEFEVLLIGLDGSVKLRQTEVLPTKELYDKIDSMPMRRSEMRRKRDKNKS